MTNGRRTVIAALMTGGGCLYVGKIEMSSQFWECAPRAQCEIVYACDTRGPCVCDIPPENCDAIDPADTIDYEECITRSSTWDDECFRWMCPSSSDPLDAYALCNNPAGYDVATQDVFLCFEEDAILGSADPLQDSRDWCAQAAGEELAREPDIGARDRVGILQSQSDPTVCFSPDDPVILSRAADACPANERFYNRDGSMQVDSKKSWLSVSGGKGMEPVYGWLKVNWRLDGSIVFLAGELTTAPQIMAPSTLVKGTTATYKGATIWLAQSVGAAPTLPRQWVVTWPTVVAEVVENGVKRKGQLTLFRDVNVRLEPGTPPRLILDVNAFDKINSLGAHIEIPVEESNRRFWNRVIRDP